MVRLLVFDGPRPGYLRSVGFAIAFAFFFLAVLSFALYYTGVPMNYFHFAVLAYSLFTVYVLYTPVADLWRGYRVRRTLSHVSITREGFSIDIPCDYGYLTVWSDGSRVHYSFAKHGETESVAQALVPETHTLVASSDGRGKLVFPAFLPKGLFYSGVVVAFAVPSYAVNLDRDHLSVERANDRVDLFLEPTDKGFSGYLRYGFSRATKAVVSIVWRGLDVEQPLAQCPESQSVIYPTVSEPILLVAHEQFLTPRNLLTYLGVDSLVQGEGNFVLRLSLHLPMEEPASDEISVWSVPRTTM